MSSQLDKMADEIDRRLKGWNCFTMSLWGGLAFQPTENIFKLISVGAKDGSLTMRFHQFDGGECELKLWGPAGLTITEDNDLIVEKVDRLQWDGENREDASASSRAGVSVKLGFSRWPA